MKVLHVVPSVSAEASGPTYTCVRRAQEIARRGHEVTLMSVGGGRVDPEDNFEHEVYPRGVPPLALRSPRLLDALREHAREADVVHSHGLWEMPAVYPGWLAAASDRPLVISPLGMMNEWAWRRSRWKKRIFWAMFQGRTVHRAACLHACSEAEYAGIRDRGMRQPVAVIPHGIDVEPDAGEEPPDGSGRRTLLFLGRVHPVKGVPTLLRAWSRLHGKYPDWELLVVGPGAPGYLHRLRRLELELALERVRFVGPLYGDRKKRMYRRAELYVLPTHTENFGVTIAEALAAGTPAVVTKGAPWAGLESEGAGWWIDHGVASLASCLDLALGLSPEELAAKGAAGREWMRRSFRWDAVAGDLTSLYRWLRGEGGLPPFVHLE